MPEPCQSSSRHWRVSDRCCSQRSTGSCRWSARNGWSSSFPPNTEDLYRVLQTEVVPLFYERDAQGVPRRWLERVRASLARLAPQFSANRMVSEYDERVYRPAEAMWRRRAADRGALAADLASWAERLRFHFPLVHWGRLELRADGETLDAEVEVYLDDIDPTDVMVELFAEPTADRPGVRATMSERRPLAGTAHGRVYGTRVAADRPVERFTPRLVPGRADLIVPGEVPLVLWHH